MNETTNFRIIIIDDNPAIHLDFIKFLKNDSTSTLDDLSAGLFGTKNSYDNLPGFEIDDLILHLRNQVSNICHPECSEGSL